jgi:hypothetical protein
MGTVDANGIYMYEDTDPLVPFASLLNTGQASVSAKFASIDPGLIHYVANVTERDDLASTFLPSASKPLFVYRGNATSGRNIEYTTNGTDWLTPIIARGESYTSYPVTTGGITTATRVALGSIASAPYPRVVEYDYVVNLTGITANVVFTAVVTTAGAVITNNQDSVVRAPLANGTATGGAIVYSGSYNLAAGAAGAPSLWIDKVSSAAGTLTIAGNSRFNVRVRQAL